MIIGMRVFPFKDFGLMPASDKAFWVSGIETRELDGEKYWILFFCPSNFTAIQRYETRWDDVGVPAFLESE